MSDAHGTGRRGLTTLAVATLLLACVASAHAAPLTTPACLAKKLTAWGNLRKCEATANGKALQSKPADLAKCQTTFDAKLANLDAQATKAAIACRYGVNGDGTVTDYDTGLQWERKTDDNTTVHDKDNAYNWNTALGGTTPNGTVFTAFLGTLNNGTSSDHTTISGCFAGHCDWRLPSIVELKTIVDLSAPGCGGGSACIDQSVFGPTDGDGYWTTTSQTAHPDRKWNIFFFNGTVDNCNTGGFCFARAVRSGL